MRVADLSAGYAPGAVVLHGVSFALEGGTITAGLSGWLAVWGTLRLVRTHSFTPFVIYRVALGVLVLVIYAAR